MYFYMTIVYKNTNIYRRDIVFMTLNNKTITWHPSLNNCVSLKYLYENMEKSNIAILTLYHIGLHKLNNKKAY